MSCSDNPVFVEVLSRLPASPRRAPPLLFVHGARHGAWCWDEHFLKYFAERGFASYAVNLRGRGLSSADKPQRLVRLSDFVADVATAADPLHQPPILIGHGLGGFVVQKYLEGHYAPLAVLMASAPPCGNLAAAWRALGRSVATPAKAKAALFSAYLPDDEAARYHAQLHNDSFVAQFEALALGAVRPHRIRAPLAVLGAENDAMISRADVEATARRYGVQPILLPGLAHDMMLDAHWRRAAACVLQEIEARCQIPAAQTSIQRAA